MSATNHAAAQLTGTITVPNATYTTLASVVSALNTQGVGAGGVVINLTANETAPTGGYKLGSATLNASTSATNTITINGGNNTLTAQVGTSTTLDGIFTIRGTDYVTINALNVTESAANTTSTTRMEWGYGLLKRNASAPFDGCQFVTIQNCAITLSRLNANARGIYLANHTDASTTALTITSAADANSNNTIAGNTIADVYSGIWLSGYNQTAAPYNLYDQNNTVGGNTAAAGNTIQNYAGGTVTIGYGVYLIYQNNSVVRFNNIDNDAGTGGIAGRKDLYGIFHGEATNATTNITNNTVHLTQDNDADPFYAISCDIAGATATAVMSKNTISGTGGSSADFYGVHSVGALHNLSMDSNVVSGMTVTSTGNNEIIANYSTATGTVSIQGNSITGITKTSTSGALWCIYGDAAGASTATSSFTIANNTISNLTVGGGTVRGIFDDNGAATGKPYKTVFGNTVSNITAGSGICFALRVDHLGSNANGTSAVYNNTVTDVTTSGTLYGIYTGPTETANIYGNTVNDLQTNGASSVVNGIYHTGGANSVVNSYRNRVYDVTAGGTSSPEVDGMYATGGAGATINLYNNFISDLKVPTGSANDAFFGIFLASATPDYKIYHNTIYLNPTNTGANFGGAGLYMTGTATSTNTVDVRNNIFNVNATASGTAVVGAMRRSGGTAGTPPPAYATTSNRNILYAPNAANTYLYAEGTTAAGAVNAFNLTNGPDFNTTCGLYKAFMSPRDNGTFTENNLSPISGTPGTFAPTGSSFAQNNAVATTAPAVSTDYFGTTRATPADVGAAEFSGTGVDAAGPLITYTALPNNTLCSAPPTLTATITDAGTGVNQAPGSAPRLYYKKSTEANAFGGANNSTFNGWKWVEATGTAPTFSFTPDYALLTSPIASGDIIQYFLIAQDSAATPNVNSVVATHPASFCPTSVNLPAAAGPLAASPAPYSYSIGTTPTTLTASASPAQICVSATVTLTLSGSSSGLGVQWQSATLAGTFSNIPGATTAPYTIPNVTSDTRYRAVVSCGGATLFTTNEDTVLAQSPSVLSTTPPAASQCGGGTFTMSATGSPGTTLRWYTESTGGALLGTGSPFTTPFINATDTFWVGAGTGSGGGGGSNSITTSTTATTSGVGTGGMMFDINAVNAFTIDSISAFFLSTSPQPFNIYVRTGTHCGFSTSPAGWTLVSTNTVTPTTTSTTVPYTFALSTPVPIPVGVTGVYFNYNARYLSATSCSSLVTTNADMTITRGTAQSALFTGTTSRAFAGTLIYSKNGCESPRTPVVAVVTPPATATAAATGPTTICPGSTVTMNASPTSAGFNYQWLLNGAAIPGATSSTYTTTQAGNYTVSVYTTPVCNDTSNTPITVVVTPVPTAVTPSGSITICTGTSQTLTGPSGTGLSYQWLQNNAIIPGATNQTYAANATGNYRVRVTTSGGCSDTSQPVAISSVSQPVSTVSPSAPAPICANGGVPLSGPVNSSYTYQWFLNGNPITGATGQTYNATAAGQYTLRTQVGTGANACSTFSSPVVVTTTPLPPTAFTASNGGNICAGSTVTLTGPVDMGYTYQWLLANAPIVGATGQTYTTSVAGSYRLKVTALATGCTDTSAATVLNARPLPAATTSPSGAGAVCYNATQTLTANAGAGLTYQWLLNTNPIAGAAGQTYVANASGQYAVRVTSSFGCVNTSAPYTLTVRPQPPGQISYTNPLTFCAGGAVVLTAAGGVPGYVYTYQWFRNGVSIPGTNSSFYQAVLAGVYTLRATDSAGCQALSPGVTVVVNPIPTVTVSANGATLSASPAFYPQYQWYLNNQQIPGATGPTHTATQQGAYRVEVVDNNGCLGQSTSLYVTTTGVGGALAAGEPILVYPNPASDILRIEAPIAVTATLRNGLGQIVLMERAAKQLDVARFPDGLYTLTLTDGNGAVVLQEKVSKVTR